MKAAVFHRSGLPLSIEEVADPECSPDGMVIRVCSCGICGTDLHWSEVNNEESGWRNIHPGAVMGHEFAGEIVEICRDVSGPWAVGDRVCAMPQLGCGRCPSCLAGKPHRCPDGRIRASREVTGAYAEYTRVGVRETLHLPDRVSFEEGALVEPLAVGLHAVKRARLQPGDSVLVVGGGPVGLCIALWSRFFGARTVAVSDLVHARAEAALGFGATVALDAAAGNVAGQFADAAGCTPDVVFDAVGVPGSLQIAVDLAAVGGRVIVVGLCMVEDRFMPSDALIKEVDIVFCFVYERADFEMVVDMLAQGRIDAAGLVTGSVGFDEFPGAFEALKRPSDQIKVMLAPA